MKTKLFKILSRTTLVCLELLAVVMGLTFLVVGVLIWRLMSGPVDVGFAKDYIEQALYDPVSGYSVSLDKVVITWPDVKSPLMLDINGVDLIKNNRTVIEIEDVSLGIAARYLLIGAIEPVTIVLDKPSLNVIRTENNDIKLSLDDSEPETDPGEDEQDPIMAVIDALSKQPEQIDKRSPLSRLQSVNIKNARMVMADYKLGITWFISKMNLGLSRDPQGLIITASAALPGGRDKASHIQGDLVYLRDQKDFRANIHIQDFDPHILSRKIQDLEWLNDHYAILNGNVEVRFDENFHIYHGAVSLSSMNGEVKLDGVYDAPLPFEELFVDAVYNEREGIADLKDLSIKAKGIEVSVSAPIKISGNKYEGPVTIKIPDLPQDKISPIWPDSLRGDGAEIWLTQKLSKGRIHDTAATFDLTAEQKDDSWSVDVENITGDFQIENMDIDYRAPLRQITAANGSGHFEDDTLTVDINSGDLGDIKVENSKVVLDKIIEGGGMADISVALNGPLQSVFRYIQPEPIGVSEEKLGLKIDDVRGTAKLNVNVRFPTIRDLLAEQVKVKADGTLHDVLLPDVVKTLDLTGGPFNIKIADGAAELDGKGKIDGYDITFGWKEYVDPDGKDFVSRVTASLTTDKALRDKMGITIDDWADGTIPVDVTYTEYAGDKSVANVKANLTPGTVMIGPMEYKKAPGQKGTATCEVTFANGYVQEVRKLNVETGELKINNGRLVFGVNKGETELKQGNLPQFYLGENDLKMEFELGKNKLLKMAVTGDFFDAQPFLGDKDKSGVYDGPHIIASIDVNRMRTHPARMVEKVKAYLNMNLKGDIEQFELDAIVGKGPIYLRFKPNDQGIMSVRLEADDAGAMLKAFDIYENAKGGKLKLYGEAASKAEPKILRGTAEMTDFNVVGAPVLAQLLNAISLFGIQQLLGGEGIYFSRLESEFEWHLNRKGDAYYFKEGRTSGSSLGLTFEGRIDKAQDLTRINGTIVPVSLVSEIIGGIPLIGDILTGGGGGLIAATYQIEGPIKQPKVSVNPLSALAPGILRTILFEN